MVKKKTKLPYDTEIVSTIIGEESELKGTIHSQGSVRIEGSLDGEIVSQGEVYIGKSVLNDVFAQRVVIAGSRNIEAVKGIKICPTGKVEGDLTGDRLIVEEGGVYKGKVNMDVISSRNLYEGKFELTST